MLSDNTARVHTQIAKKQHSNATMLNEIRSFTYPKLYTGKDWYVAFQAFCPATGSLRRKRIKINSVGNSLERRKYSSMLCHRLATKLEAGWNPWIESENSNNYKLFADAVQHYRNYVMKMYNEGIYREETYSGYISYSRMMERFNAQRSIPIYYVYQFDRAFCVEFLDYIFVDRENSAQTRNNYLIFLNVFSSFLVQHLYQKERATAGITAINRRCIRKERTQITANDMQRLHDYLIESDKHYLLACYFLHYVLIRPKEMSQLRVGYISLKDKTILVPAEISKNKKSARITLPMKVVQLLIDLRVFDCPSTYYLFSNAFMPGAEWRDEKQFRDYWSYYVRKRLNFPKEYKFYSLKDTGITAMLRAGCDVQSVKEQARHSSLLMTDIYTPHDIQEANELLLHYDGIL